MLYAAFTFQSRCFMKQWTTGIWQEIAWKCVCGNIYYRYIWGRNEIILQSWAIWINLRHQLRPRESQHLEGEWRASWHLLASRWGTIYQRAGWLPLPLPSPCTLPEPMPAASLVQLPQSEVHQVFPALTLTDAQSSCFKPITNLITTPSPLHPHSPSLTC